MGLEQFDTILAFSAVMLTLSLLITILVQMVLTVLNTRGRALGWGVERLLQQLDPQLKLEDMAGKLSQAILKHPALTHRGAMMAIAIRKDELLKVLEDLAARDRTTAAPYERVKFWPLVKPAPPLTADERQRLNDAIRSLVPGATAEQAKAAEALAAEVRKVIPGADAALARAASNVLEAKNRLEREVDKWFDTVMDRTTEYFVIQTRKVTIAVAVVVAFALHVDALGIFAQLTSSKELRGKWTEAGASMLQEAEKLSVDTTEPYPLAGKAILALKADPKLKDPDKKKLEETPSTKLVTRAEGEKWAAEHLTPEGQKLFADKMDEVAKKRMEELSAAFTKVRAVAAGTSLQIVQIPSPWPPGMSYLGVVMSALLLGLGAPFWFNLLKQLTNLRPLLAGKVEDKDKGK